MNQTPLVRLTDKNVSGFFKNTEKPFLILFESRHDPNAAKMIDAFTAAANRFPGRIHTAVCVVEETSNLSERYGVFGVPTIVAGHMDKVLYKSLGIRSEEELFYLIRQVLQMTSAQRKGMCA